MSIVDKKRVKFTSLIHIVFITYFVLLSGKTCKFNRKEDFKSIFKEEQRSSEALKNQRMQDGGLHERAPLRTTVLQALKPRTAVHPTSTWHMAGRASRHDRASSRPARPHDFADFWKQLFCILLGKPFVGSLLGPISVRLASTD